MATFKTSSMILGEIAAKLSGRPFHPDGFDDEGDALEIIKENIGTGGGGGDGLGTDTGYIDFKTLAISINGHYYQAEDDMWVDSDSGDAIDIFQVLAEVEDSAYITLYSNDPNTIDTLKEAFEKKDHLINACDDLCSLDTYLGFNFAEGDSDYENYAITWFGDRLAFGWAEIYFTNDCPVLEGEVAGYEFDIQQFIESGSEPQPQTEPSYYFNYDEGLLYEEGSNRQIVYSQEGPEVVEYIMSHPNKIKMFASNGRVSVGTCSQYQAGEDEDSYQILFPEGFYYRPGGSQFEQYTTIVKLAMDSDRDAIGCNLVVEGRVAYETEWE